MWGRDKRFVYKMAALLKKRALAEFSQVIQEEPPRPPKRKLRLTKVSLFGGINVEQLKTATPAESLNLLLSLSENVSSDNPNIEDVQILYPVLVGELGKQSDFSVKNKIVSILCQMVKLRMIPAPALLEELVPLLREKMSHKVLAQMMETLHEIGRVSQTDATLQLRIILLAKQYLSDSSHQVKSKCLEIICDFTPLEGLPDQIQSSVQVLAEHACNQDPRVRTVGLQSLLHLHDRGFKLDISLYDDVSKSVYDDYEGVRMGALKLIQVMSQLYPERLVDVPNGQEKIRLIDDAFAKVCSSVNDLSMNVRVLAASLLGNMTGVSLQFLEQTLDKKLMSNLRKKRSAHERQKENFTSGEWSSGQKWADDAPKELVDAENVSLINTGACGAFVHGLEDEFLEVRSASLDSLCQLALKFDSFARLSLDFLVDMFNDEIEEVRLKAIQCLGNISHHIVLREDQMETILAVLEDFSMDIREALHKMLGNCQLSTKAGLKACIDNLLENLKRYPQDKRSIWGCLKNLGSRHPYLTLPLVPELLGIHPYLELPEPDVEDPMYISILILVFNSAAKCPTMMSLFVDYTLRHHAYLRDSLPSLVPPLKLPNQSAAPPPRISSLNHSKKFLRLVLERVNSCETKNVSTRMNILSTAITDLQKLSEIESDLSAAANCLGLFIQCELLYLKVISNQNWYNPTALFSVQNSTLKSSLERLLQLTFCLTHRFLGLRSEEVACFFQLRLRALAMQLVLVIRSNTSALALCDTFLDQVQAIQRYLDEHGLQADSFTSAVFRELEDMEEPKPGSVARLLQPLLLQHPCPTLRPCQLVASDLERIRQASATIHEPSGESDNAYKFTAGLVQGVTIDAQIENIENIKSVRVKIKYPDQQVQLVLPQLSDFRHQGAQNYRLFTTVLLSHSVWSEACSVDISMILDFSDLEGSSKSNVKSVFGTRMEENIIELCKAVQVYIAPKPVKKGVM